MVEKRVPTFVARLSQECSLVKASHPHAFKFFSWLLHASHHCVLAEAVGTTRALPSQTVTQELVRLKPFFRKEEHIQSEGVFLRPQTSHQVWYTITAQPEHLTAVMWERPLTERGVSPEQLCFLVHEFVALFCREETKMDKVMIFECAGKLAYPAVTRINNVCVALKEDDALSLGR